MIKICGKVIGHSFCWPAATTDGAVQLSVLKVLCGALDCHFRLQNQFLAERPNRPESQDTLRRFHHPFLVDEPENVTHFNASVGAIWTAMASAKSKTGHVRGDVKVKAIRTVTPVSQSAGIYVSITQYNTADRRLTARYRCLLMAMDLDISPIAN